MLSNQIHRIQPEQHSFPANLSISNQGPEDAAEIKLNPRHLTSLDFEHTHVSLQGLWQLTNIIVQHTCHIQCT